MAHEIRRHYTAGAVLYAVLINDQDQFWRANPAPPNVPAWEAYVAGHWDEYAIPLTHTGAGYYSGDFPSGIMRGRYTALFYVRLGGAPAITDTPLERNQIIEWNGTIEQPLSSVLVDGQPLPDAMAVSAALIAGKSSGVTDIGPSTEIYKGLDGLTDRASIDIDVDGNRSAAIYSGIPILNWKAEMTKPNNIVRIPSGIHNDGVALNRVAAGVRVYGQGRDGPNETRLQNYNFTQSAQGCMWEMSGDDIRFEDIALQADTLVGQQNQVFGVQHNYSAPPVEVSNCTARLYRCKIWAHTFGIYIWGGDGNVIYAYDTPIVAGRLGVTGGGGSGPAAQSIYLYNCEIIIDYDAYPGAGGDQGFNALGLLARGGYLGMFGGSIDILGPSVLIDNDHPIFGDTPPVGLPEYLESHAYGAASCFIPEWDPADRVPPLPPYGYTWPLTELFDVRCRVVPQLAVHWADVRNEVGIINIYGGSGSGVGGAWILAGSNVANINVYP